MTVRRQRTGYVLRCALLLGVALAQSASLKAQSNSDAAVALRFDGRRLERAFQTSSPSVRDLLAAALTVQMEGDPDRPIALVLYAFKVANGAVVSKFRSGTFSIQPGGATRIPAAALPAAGWFGDTAPADPEGFLPASQAIRGDAAVRDPMSFVADGIFFKPADWKLRVMVYLAAIPALDGSSKDPGWTRPVLIILGGAASGR
jgi:hypothetical protein